MTSFGAGAGADDGAHEASGNVGAQEGAVIVVLERLPAAPVLVVEERVAAGVCADAQLDEIARLERHLAQRLRLLAAFSFKEQLRTGVRVAYAEEVPELLVLKRRQPGCHACGCGQLERGAGIERKVLLPACEERGVAQRVERRLLRMNRQPARPAAQIDPGRLLVRNPYVQPLRPH